MARYTKKNLINMKKEVNALDLLQGDAKLFTKMQVVKRKCTEKWEFEEQILGQCLFSSRHYIIIS